MIAPAFCMWRFAISGELKAPPDHPQSSLNPQGTVGPPGLPVVVGGFADAPAGASRIARTLATAARVTRLTNQSSQTRQPASSGETTYQARPSHSLCRAAGKGSRFVRRDSGYHRLAAAEKGYS